MRYNDSFFIKLFILIVIIGFIINFMWLLDNTSIQDCYSQEGLFFSIQLLNRMQETISESSFNTGRKIVEIFKMLRVPVEYSRKVWPQFTYFTTSLFHLMFGRTLLVDKLSMWPYLFILIISVFAIGKSISSPLGGMIAAYLIFMYPLILEGSRQYASYLPPTALVSLSILFLLKCNSFRSLKYSVLLGVVVGIGMLIRAQILFFVGIPILCVILDAIKSVLSAKRKLWNNIATSRNMLVNIGVFIIVSSLISYIWWGDKLTAGLSYLKMFIYDPEKLRLFTGGGEDKYSLVTVTRYLKDMYSTSVSPLLFLFFLSAIYRFTKKAGTERYILFSWLIIPFLLFSLVFIPKYPDYLMPAYPAIAIITGWWIVGIDNKKLRLIILHSIILYSIMQFYCLTFGDEKLRGGIEGSNKLIGGSIFGDVKSKQDFKIDDVINVLHGCQVNREGRINVLLVNLTKERPWTLETIYWLMLKDRCIKTVDLINFPKDFLYNLEDADFIIFKLTKYYVLPACPTKMELLEFLRNSLSPGVYNYKIKHSDWNSLFDKFIIECSKYKIVSIIPAPLDYNWLIFKNPSSVNF